MGLDRLDRIRRAARHVPTRRDATRRDPLIHPQQTRERTRRRTGTPATHGRDPDFDAVVSRNRPKTVFLSCAGDQCSSGAVTLKR